MHPSLLAGQAARCDVRLHPAGQLYRIYTATFEPVFRYSKRCAHAALQAFHARMEVCSQVMSGIVPLMVTLSPPVATQHSLGGCTHSSPQPASA